MGKSAEQTGCGCRTGAAADGAGSNGLQLLVEKTGQSMGYGEA